MSGAYKIHWTIMPSGTPRPILPCRRCGAPRPFASSGKFRLNANGQRLDAWLIYRCADCDETWNRPLAERRDVRSLEPGLLRAFEHNDPDHARAVAFDVEGLRRFTATVETGEATGVAHNEPLPQPLPARLEIGLSVPAVTSLRLDRLLARELGLSRRRLAEMDRSGGLAITPGGAKALRRPVRDGTVVRIDTRS